MVTKGYLLLVALVLGAGVGLGIATHRDQRSRGDVRAPLASLSTQAEPSTQTPPAPSPPSGPAARPTALAPASTGWIPRATSYFPSPIGTALAAAGGSTADIPPAPPLPPVPPPLPPPSPDAATPPSPSPPPDAAPAPPPPNVDAGAGAAPDAASLPEVSPVTRSSFDDTDRVDPHPVMDRPIARSIFDDEDKQDPHPTGP
ncbi:MAG TPA: hypothetical protein VNO55_05820 [Polyangia bacterium]|nr:hypothetical protein [Polyangia bacterium]